MIRVKHVAYCPYDPRYYLVLDPAEIYPDDPGNGTPVMVYFDFAGIHHASATYGCAIGEGELMRSDCGTWALPSKVYEWLEGLHEYVEQFLAEDPPAPVDLEQFREPVTCWHDAALPANDVEVKRKAEAKRLLSIIDSAGKVDSKQPAPVDLERVDRTDRELLVEFIRICREHKPVGQWPGERLCSAIERVMQNEKPFRFIAETDMAPERGHNGRGGDADRPFSGPKRAQAQQPAAVVGDARMARALEWVRQETRGCIGRSEHLPSIEEAYAAYDPSCGARTVRVVDVLAAVRSEIESALRELDTVTATDDAQSDGIGCAENALSRALAALAGGAE